METVSPSFRRMSLQSAQKSNMADSTELFQEWQKKRRQSVPPLTRKESSDTLKSKSSGRTSFRRQSSLKCITQSISGILGLRRLTLTKAKAENKVKMENTYKMGPDQDAAFCGMKVRQLAETILEEELADKSYDHVICGNMACDLGIKIKASVKDLNMPRYKIVCQVIVGQVRDQGLEAVSRSVWDPKTDNFECVSYKNNSIFAIAMIHGIYYE